ncbi:MAG: fimbria major subunit [Dysgonomonas sp.]
MASTIQWTLDVTNKKLFWLRKPTFRKGGRDNHKDDLNMEQPTDYLTKDPENNNISNRAYLYAEDPNFSVGFSSLSALQLADEFQYLYYLSDDKIVWKNVSEDLYVTENTMETKEVFENVVTQMVIRVGYSTASKPFDGSQFFYYYVPIRHFTDTLTEQEVEITNDDDVNPGGSEEGEGGFVGGEGKDKKWGSCAVVRNNVYVLNLKSIQRLGINSISLPPKENIPLE